MKKFPWVMYFAFQFGRYYLSTLSCFSNRSISCKSDEAVYPFGAFYERTLYKNRVQIYCQYYNLSQYVFICLCIQVLQFGPKMSQSPPCVPRVARPCPGSWPSPTSSSTLTTKRDVFASASSWSPSRSRPWPR